MGFFPLNKINLSVFIYYFFVYLFTYFSELRACVIRFTPFWVEGGSLAHAHPNLSETKQNMWLFLAPFGHFLQIPESETFIFATC